MGPYIPSQFEAKVSDLAPHKLVVKMKHTWLSICLLLSPPGVHGEFSISKNGQAICAVVQQSDASEPERFAFRELTNMLQQITGAQFKVSQDPQLSEHAII